VVLRVEQDIHTCADVGEMRLPAFLVVVLALMPCGKMSLNG
jgi:hypothetical protein